MDRDQYTIATLWQPGKPWEPWAPQPQYNGRLVITHGASCDTTYGTGTAPSVQDPEDPRRRVHRDVHRAGQRGAQLQPPHARPSRW